jgi:hypothetical protein
VYVDRFSDVRHERVGDLVRSLSVGGVGLHPRGGMADFPDINVRIGITWRNGVEGSRVACSCRERD